MVKVSIERKVHYYYDPLIINNFKEQSAEFKKFLDLIGKYYGYSAMNVFLTYFIIYWTHRITGREIMFYERVLRAAQ